MPAFEMLKIASLDVDIPLGELTPEEMEHFDAYWDYILDQYESVLRHTLTPYKDHVVSLIRAVKTKIERTIFFEGQLPSDNNLGISFVKPSHLTLGTGVTGKADVFTVSFDAEWKTLAEGTMDDEAGVVLFGVISLSDSPVIDGIRFTVGQRTLIPIDLSKIKLKDNRNGIALWKFDTVYILPKDYYRIEVHSAQADATNPPTEDIVLLGFTVATGNFLKTHF